MDTTKVMARRLAPFMGIFGIFGIFVATSWISSCGGSGSKGGQQPVAGAETPAEQGQLTRDAWAKSQGLELKKFDLNRDKEPDVYKFFRIVEDPRNPGNQVEKIVRKEIDINHDGKIDVIRIYGDAEEVVEEHTDLDFDGLVDEVAFFKLGELVRKEIDINYDAAPDILKYYAKNTLQRIESDRDGDGRIDTWEYYEGGVIDRIGTDFDGDGEVDNWEKKKTVEAEAPTEDAVEEPAAEQTEGGAEAEGEAEAPEGG